MDKKLISHEFDDLRRAGELLNASMGTYVAYDPEQNYTPEQMEDLQCGMMRSLSDVRHGATIRPSRPSSGAIRTTFFEQPLY